jgi:chromosome segregation ATPase
VAPMVPNPWSAEGPTAIPGLLMNFTDRVVQLSVLHIDMKQAVSVLERAKREQQSMQPHFDGFAAIKEQKTRATAHAEAKLQALKKQIDDSTRKQRQLEVDIAGLFKIAEVQPKPILPNNENQQSESVSLEEFKELKKKYEELQVKFSGLSSGNGQATRKVEELELKVQLLHSQVLGDEVDGVVGLASLGKDFANLSNNVDGLGAKLKDLEDKVLDARNETADSEHRHKELSKRLTEAEKKVTRFSHELMMHPKNIPQRLDKVESKLQELKSEVNKNPPDLVARVEKLEKPRAMAEAAPKKQTSDQGDLAGRVDKVEQALAASNASARLEKLENDFQRFETDQDTRDEVIGGDQEAIREDVKRLAEQRENDVQGVNTLNAALDEEIQGLKKKVEPLQQKGASIDDIHNTIREYSATLRSLETRLSSKVDKDFVMGSLEPVIQKHVASAVSARLGSQAPPPPPAPSRTPTPVFGPGGGPGPRLQNGNAPPPANGFQPQLNGSPQINGVASSPLGIEPKLNELQARCDALTAVVQRLQTQYNNLTTGEICQAMLDQIADIYPHAKNWEKSSRELSVQINNCMSQLVTNQTLKEQIGTVSMVANQALALSKDKVSDELKKQVNDMAKKMDELEKGARAHFMKIESKIEGNSARIARLDPD